MDVDEGGWARYGLTGHWNYVDENETSTTIELITPAEIKEMMDLKYNRFLVQTDVDFSFQAHTSRTPTTLTTRSIPWLDETKVTIAVHNNNETGYKHVITFAPCSGKLANISSNENKILESNNALFKGDNI